MSRTRGPGYPSLGAGAAAACQARAASPALGARGFLQLDEQGLGLAIAATLPRPPPSRRQSGGLWSACRIVRKQVWRPTQSELGNVAKHVVAFRRDAAFHPYN